MDISAKAWLIVIGVLLVAAVILDGYRRMRKNNSIAFGELREVSDDVPTSELPNGGARVISRKESFKNFDDLRSPVFPDESWGDADTGAYQDNTEEQEHNKPKVNIDELFVVNVIQKNHYPFDPDDLLSALLTENLHFGDMNIFHLVPDDKSEISRPIFSVANAIEPGIFDIDNMSAYPTPGLSFFMTLPGPLNPLRSFDDMLRCARNIAQKLDADLKDSEHNLLTSQSSMADRQRIEDYMRRSFRASVE